MKKIISRRKRKNKNLKYIVSVLLLSLIIYYTNNVKAGMNDSLLEVNKVDDIYAIIYQDKKEIITNLNIYKINEKIEKEREKAEQDYNKLSNSLADKNGDVGQEQIEKFSVVFDL